MDRIFNRWDFTDEENWKKGRMFCWMTGQKYMAHWGKIKITLKPPEACPFYLEHILETQK